jgi:predicted nucleotidyltransferase
VRYVVIGAMALPHHGYGRSTLDIDLLIEPTPENAARTRAALLRFGFDMTDVSVEDLLQFKVLIRDYSVQVDLHPFVAGVVPAQVFARAEPSTIAGVQVLVPCLDDMILMKEAAGRPRDREDLKFLYAVRDRK